MRTLLGLFVALVLLSSQASALDASGMYLDIDVDNSGRASVSVMMEVDSTEGKNIPVPVKCEDVLTVYDGSGDLEYSMKEGKVLVKPREEASSYSVMVDYITGSLTEKSGELWTASYPIASYDFIGFDSVDNAYIRLKLPEGAYSKSFTDDATVSVVDNRILLAWELKDLKEKELFIEAHYTMIEQGRSSADGTPFALITIFLVLTAFSVSKRRRGISKEKRKSIRALPENERLVIGILMAADGAMTQSEIAERLNLHKSTISRSVRTLENKKMVKMVSRGNSKMVELSEDFLRS